MLAVRVSLQRAASTPTQAEAELVRDALWAHAVPADFIEHITVIPVQNSIEVVLFISSRAESPTARAHDLIHRAATGSPAVAA